MVSGDGVGNEGSSVEHGNEDEQATSWNISDENPNSVAASSAVAEEATTWSALRRRR
jgi:hypothetical protein